jgi:arylsulfatase A-like enzyme
MRFVFLNRRPPYTLPGIITLLMLLAACSSEDSGNRVSDATVDQRDIILITVDTLRSDHMSLYGYERLTTPHLDEFFRDGAIFTQAYSTESNTPSSVASILSGLLPQEHGVRIFYQLLDDDIEILSQFLAPSHQTAAFVSNTVLTDEAMGMASRFDYFDDFVSSRESMRMIYERDARKTTDAALAWLRGQRDKDRPLFLWLHYIDPHGPYNPPQDWPRSFSHDARLPIDPETTVPRYMIKPGADILYYVDAYDEEIAFVDHEVDRFLTGYSGLYAIDEAMIVFTADHGETLMEHELWFQHGYNIYEELIRVPLAIRGPGVEASLRNELTSSIDLVPTILAYSGYPIPRRMRGRDLFAPLPESTDQTIFAEAVTGKVQYRAAVQNNMKWVQTVFNQNERAVLGGNGIYNLVTDAGETRFTPWPDRSSVPAQALLSLIETDPDPAGRPLDLIHGQRLTGPKIAPSVSEENLEALRSLGYLE